MATTNKERLESHWRILHPSTYLCAADLRGRPRKVKIKSVSVDELPVEGTSAKKSSVLIEFEGVAKKLVANKTNLRAVASLYGDFTADWIGQWVELYPTSKEASGKPIKDPQTKRVTEAIRIRGKDVAATDSAAGDDQPKETEA